MKDTMVRQLYDLKQSEAGLLLAQYEYPWEVLPYIGDYVRYLGRTMGSGDDYRWLDGDAGIWVHKSSYIAPTAFIQGPCFIGPNCEIRHGAYIRREVLIGEGCVVGNSVELKNSILFNGVQVPHFNYVGDSVLGYMAHFGAGAVTSNVRGDKQNVVVGAVETGRKKVGAFVGDYGEIGCNAVLNPGTVIGQNTQVYPTACVRGIIPADSIYKADGTVVKKTQKK